MVHSTRTSPSRFPSLSPVARWALVAVIVASSLLLVISAATRCYLRKIQRHKLSESTLVRLPCAPPSRSLWWSRNVPETTLHEKTTMEGAKEGDLTDTVIEISEHLRQPHRASTSLSREGTSSLGTSTLLNESSERSTIPRSGASVSTASVYSQDMSLPSDSSAAAIGLTTAADLCGSAYCPEERSLQTPAPVLLRPESLVKPLREDHSCASTLFQDAKPIPVFELAAADARPGGLASSRPSWSSSSGAALSDVSRTTESSLPTYIPLSIKPPTQSAVLRKFSAFSLTGPPIVELGFGRRGTSYL